MGMVVLMLALAQGGPGVALAALGRGVGLMKPSTSMLNPRSVVVPEWVYEQTPTATPTAGRTANAVGRTSAGAKPAGLVTPNPADDLGFSRATTWSFPDEPRLETMRALIIMTLKERELAFDGVNGRVLSFYPGEGYEKLWARDLATILPAAQYLYGDEYLRSGVEEFLQHQYKSDTPLPGASSEILGPGALPGVISTDGKLRKDTVTSDEETSVIHAAYTYYRANGGTAWLKKDLGGVTVLERLNAAIEWLYDTRFDTTHHLIKRGNTTDWGDVKEEPSLVPTQIDPKFDHWTASIYDQALAYRALRELAEMNQVLGRDDKAKTNIARSDDLRQASNIFLWMPERGYYRLHIHITPLTHRGFNEDDMVSIGNAVAIYCGMTSAEQERSIFKALEDARLAAGARKPGLSLYPAYPTGYFTTVQRNRGEYQNGGLWDWWGGVQMSAEFKQGYSDLALAHLYQMASDWALHPNVIYEWTLPNSAFGRGAEGYASAAGTVGEAIISGLYGLNISRDGVRIEPHLGTHNGDARVYQASTGRYVAYTYTYQPGAITLRYGTNSSKDVSLRVLIPAGRLVQTVRAGDMSIVPRRETVGNDVFAIFKAPPGINTVTITLAAAPVGSGGQAIDPTFFDFYHNNDGGRLLGAPLTEAITDTVRRVQYFEKGKVEDHRSDSNDPAWHFSYGLMGEEMVRSGAALPVGGEKSTVTYADLKAAAADSKRVAAPKGFSTGVMKNKDGTVFIPFSSDLSAAPGHNVAAIFWIVLSSDTRSPGGWLHDIGLPLTEPITATVDKGAQKGRKIVIQAFRPRYPDL